MWEPLPAPPTHTCPWLDLGPSSLCVVRAGDCVQWRHREHGQKSGYKASCGLTLSPSETVPRHRSEPQSMPQNGVRGISDWAMLSPGLVGEGPDRSPGAVGSGDFCVWVTILVSSRCDGPT